MAATASRALAKGPPQNNLVHRGRRCATPVRHEESSILEYSSDEQRHWRRCSGGRMPTLFCGGPLGPAAKQAGAPRAPMRDASKARGVEHTGVFERRAAPLAAMQRWALSYAAR